MAATQRFRFKVVEGWGRGPHGKVFGGIIPGVATDSQDRVYLTRRDPPAVLVYDREGRFLTSWGERLFVNPHGIFVSHDDYVWVTDVEDHTVRKFSTDGTLLLTLGTPGKPGPPDMPFNMPTKAVTTPAGEIIVSDGYGQNRIHRFSADGKLLNSWGSQGAGPGQFGCPHGAWVDRRNRVLVADRPNNRLQLFTLDGTYLTQWTDIEAPNDICTDQDDNVYVAQAGLRQVSVLSPQGELLARWGEHGSQPGKFPDYPHGIWVDSHGDLYVAEVPFLDNRLQKFTRKEADDTPSVPETDIQRMTKRSR